MLLANIHFPYQRYFSIIYLFMFVFLPLLWNTGILVNAVEWNINDTLCCSFVTFNV